jgi:hypothetical protein
MIAGKITNNIKTRRKGSMLQDSLSKLKYFLLLALLVIPVHAIAGDFFVDDDPIDQTDGAAHRLIFFWDTLNGRQSVFQVTNTSDDFITVHVQVFNASNLCEEVDFFVTLTPNDTVIYDIENLPPGSDLSNANGFVAVTDLDGTDIIGMFRVFDPNGYEYRTNAADSEAFFFEQQGFADPAFENTLNFNDVNGNALSDVVGITYAVIDNDSVYASSALGTLFGAPFATIEIYDEFENFTSCSETIFACDDGFFNYGIDNSIPNSQGFDRICNTSTLSGSNAGWLYMPFIQHVSIPGSFVQCDEEFCSDPVFFVGYLGLNNGDGTGSMDSWWSNTAFFVQDGPVDEMPAAENLDL